MSDDSGYSGGYDSGPSSSSPSYDPPSPPVYQPTVAVTDGDRVVGHESTAHLARLDDLGDYDRAPGVLPPGAHMNEPFEGAYSTGGILQPPFSPAHQELIEFAAAALKGSPAVLIDPSLIMVPEPVVIGEVDDEEWHRMKAAASTLLEPVGYIEADIEERERTQLESGQLIYHHTAAECSGNCCLHGTSEWESCSWPRAWRTDLGRLVHLCKHDVQHDCEAGRQYRNQGVSELDEAYDTGHGCDLCCDVADRFMTEEDRLDMGQQAIDARLTAAVASLFDLGGIVEGMAHDNLRRGELHGEMLKSLHYTIAGAEETARKLKAESGDRIVAVAQLQGRLAELERANRGWWWKRPICATVGVLAAWAIASGIGALFG